MSAPVTNIVILYGHVISAKAPNNNNNNNMATLSMHASSMCTIASYS